MRSGKRGPVMSTDAPHPTDEKTLSAEVIDMTTFVLVHGAFGSPAELAPV